MAGAVLGRDLGPSSTGPLGILKLTIIRPGRAASDRRRVRAGI